jgi:DNA-directed RNA polymerase specialized sigma subunit
MYEFIKKLCHKLCSNFFDSNSEQCTQEINLKEKLAFLIFSSTEKKVKINRQINQFCKLHKNRFWMLYYRSTEIKIDFKCQQGYKFELCQTYILKRIIKYIKAFDSKQESVVFTEVRKNILNQNSNTYKNRSETNEVITHYNQKIIKLYHEKVFDNLTTITLVENIIYKIGDSKLETSIEERLQRYKFYNASAVLHDIIQNKEKENPKVKEIALLELLEREKFLNYIKAPIESRFIDFTRSKAYVEEQRDDSDEMSSEEKATQTEHSIEPLLKKLSNEKKIFYKLKYGLELDNREFLTVSYHFKSRKEGLMKLLNAEEKLYIKFKIHYNLKESSKHFSFFKNLPLIKSSISKKILDYREKLSAHSYREEQEEMVMKLIYTEPLTAKEIGELFSFTDKQIHKKIENITKKLKKWKHHDE